MGKTARLLLKNKWVNAVLTTITVLLLLLTAPFLQMFFFTDEWALIISMIIALLLVNPTTLGYKRWCATLKPNEKARFCDLFYFFRTPKRYFKSVFVGLAVSLRVLLKAVLSMTVPATFFAISEWLKSQTQTEITEIFTKNCVVLGLCAVVIFIIVFFISASQTIATTYFVAVDENTKIYDAMRLSSRFMKEKSAHILKTVSPYLIFCVFVFPIFIIIPYFVTVFIQYVKSFKQEITFACV